MAKLMGLILLAIAALLLLLEGALRWRVGLGRPPLYISDPEIGYLLAPNQATCRFGNRIAINQYSMRSDPISPQRPHDALRVMLLGDSLVNGGWWTEQSATLSALMQRQLESILQKKVEVLNAAANSWGPRNQLAYLKKFGPIESQVVILLMNTDDLFATAPTDLPVGRDRNYPDRRPATALGELWQLMFGSDRPIPGMDRIRQEPGDRVGNNLAALETIAILARREQAQFLIGITPLKREVDGSERRDYEKKARHRLQDWAGRSRVQLIDFLEPFSTEPSKLYRDHIHLSPKGNLLVSDRLSQATVKLLESER
jgi:lysophospholipase L1-like esterase